ncbi:MAG: hypothetical protein ACLR0N_03465 [Bilophila wadsworthia]
MGYPVTVFEAMPLPAACCGTASPRIGFPTRSLRPHRPA